MYRHDRCSPGPVMFRRDVPEAVLKSFAGPKPQGIPKDHTAQRQTWHVTIVLAAQILTWMRVGAKLASESRGAPMRPQRIMEQFGQGAPWCCSISGELKWRHERNQKKLAQVGTNPDIRRGPHTITTDPEIPTFRTSAIPTARHFSALRYSKRFKRRLGDNIKEIVCNRNSLQRMPSKDRPSAKPVMDYLTARGKERHARYFGLHGV